MKLKSVMTLVLFVSATVSIASGQEFTINGELDGNETDVVQLSIKDDMAITKCNGVTEHFDLKNQRWQHEETKQWVTLAECESWAKQSKEKSENSSIEVPDEIRTFINWSLDPKFEINSSEGKLELISGQVDYRIEVEKSDRDYTNFYRYAKLNAYKKAMTLRKVLPFAELATLQELEKRKLFPKSMEIKIPGAKGSPTIKMTITQVTK
jgi:hypothetical protein